MVAVRLLPLAAAVALSVSVNARPLYTEGLSLRSFGSEAYDDGALALREPFDEDSLEEFSAREPIILTEAEIRLNFPPPPPRVPGTPATNKPLPAKPPAVPGNPSTNKPLPAKPKKRSFDEDELEEFSAREPIILTEAEMRLNFPPPPPRVPGTPATNKPLPAKPPAVPGKPANNKPLPAKPKKRSFDEDELDARAMLDEILEELLRREYFVDMDLD